MRIYAELPELQSCGAAVADADAIVATCRSSNCRSTARSQEAGASRQQPGATRQDADALPHSCMDGHGGVNNIFPTQLPGSRDVCGI